MGSDPDGKKFLDNFFDDAKGKAYQEKRRQQAVSEQERQAFEWLKSFYMSALKGYVRIRCDQFCDRLRQQGHTDLVAISEDRWHMDLSYPGVRRYRIELVAVTLQVWYGFLASDGNSFENDRPVTLQLGVVENRIVPKPSHGEELRGDNEAEHSLYPFFGKISERLKLK